MSIFAGLSHSAEECQSLFDELNISYSSWQAPSVNDAILACAVLDARGSDSADQAQVKQLQQQVADLQKQLQSAQAPAQGSAGGSTTTSSSSGSTGGAAS